MRVFEVGLLFISNITDSQDMWNEISKTVDSFRKIFPIMKFQKLGAKSIANFRVFKIRF